MNGKMNVKIQFIKLGHIRANKSFFHFSNFYSRIGKSCLKLEWQIIVQCILRSVILWLQHHYLLCKYMGNYICTYTFVFLPVVTYSKYSWISITNIIFFFPLLPLLFSFCWLQPVSPYGLYLTLIPLPIFRLAWPTKDPEQFPEPTEKLEKNNLTNSMIPIKKLLQNCRFPHR